MRHLTVIYASLLFLLLGFSLLLSGQSITGDITSAEVKDQVKTFVSRLPAASVVDDANICMIIPLSPGEAAFDIKKSAGIVTLKENCAALSTYDVVIKYTSYAAFLKEAQDPNIDFSKGHGTDYVLLPSKAIAVGGEFSCNAEFRQKYCIVPYLYLTKTELAAVNNCCADYELSASQKARLEQVKPTGFLALLVANFVALSILFAVLLFIIIFSFVLTKRIKKTSKEQERINELKSYVVDMMSKGYSVAGIKESLASAGWTSSQIDEAFK